MRKSVTSITMKLRKRAMQTIKNAGVSQHRLPKKAGSKRAAKLK